MRVLFTLIFILCPSLCFAHGALWVGDGNATVVAGLATYRVTSADAGQVAKEECQKEGGRNCKQAIVFDNACVAIASKVAKTGETEWGYGNIPIRPHLARTAQLQEAQTAALALCKALYPYSGTCTVLKSACDYYELPSVFTIAMRNSENFVRGIAAPVTSGGEVPVYYWFVLLLLLLIGFALLHVHQLRRQVAALEGSTAPPPPRAPNYEPQAQQQPQPQTEPRRHQFRPEAPPPEPVEIRPEPPRPTEVPRPAAAPSPPPPQPPTQREDLKAQVKAKTLKKTTFDI